MALLNDGLSAHIFGIVCIDGTVALCTPREHCLAHRRLTFLHLILQDAMEARIILRVEQFLELGRRGLNHLLGLDSDVRAVTSLHDLALLRDELTRRSHMLGLDLLDRLVDLILRDFHDDVRAEIVCSFSTSIATSRA